MAPELDSGASDRPLGDTPTATSPPDVNAFSYHLDHKWALPLTDDPWRRGIGLSNTRYEVLCSIAILLN
jgi:hypothetical protein